VGSDYWDDYFKFAFVRNPYDRAVSWYEYRKRPEAGHPTRGLSFEDFLGHGPLWRACYELICDESCNVLVDYVGRYENLEGDVSDVMKTLGLPFGGLPRLNGSPSRRDYREYFTDDVRELLPDNYKMDLKVFGYE
jgi:hypothetical protein